MKQVVWCFVLAASAAAQWRTPAPEGVTVSDEGGVSKVAHSSEGAFSLFSEQSLAARPGSTSGPYNHPLRVYLIDGQKQIRNIYSYGLLDPRLVMTDVRTLMMANTRGLWRQANRHSRWNQHPKWLAK